MTGLSQQKIDQYHSKYIEACEHDGVMNVNKFIRLYSQLPLKNTTNLEERAVRLFHAFDRDHNGVLTFDEFLSVITLINYEMTENQFSIENEISPNINEIKHRRSKPMNRNIRALVLKQELIDYLNRPLATNQ
ncbi:hypothetical protein I4U23_017766 [Adineta vaga]|nr:hypothetical protein I4U23_017766 [Adineta vaga]